MVDRSRTGIYNALFALMTPMLAPGAVAGPSDGRQADGLKALAGVPTLTKPFNLVTRDVIEVQSVPPGLQPVLMQLEMDDEFSDAGNGLVAASFVVYFIIGMVSRDGMPAVAALDPLIDAVTAALQPPVGEDLQTLGGRVERVQIKGKGGKNAGNNSTADVRQAAYYLPVEITTSM